MKISFYPFALLVACCILCGYSCKGKKKDQESTSQTNRLTYRNKEKNEGKSVHKQSYQENRYQEWRADSCLPEYYEPCNFEDRGYTFKNYIIAKDRFLDLEKYSGKPDFIKDVLFENKEPEYLAKAINFVSRFRNLDPYPGEIVPIPFKCALYENADKEVGYCTIELPVSERRFINYSFQADNRDFIPYAKIVDYLSKNRFDINIYKLYEKNKEIALKLISKQSYLEFYRPTISSLIYAYHDLQDNKDFFGLLDAFLYNRGELAESIDRAHISLHSILQKHFEDKKSEQRDNANSHLFTTIDRWQAYLFWMRRHNEGNAFNIYYTLNKFKDDYESQIRNLASSDDVDLDDLFLMDEENKLDDYVWGNMGYFKDSHDNLVQNTSYAKDIDLAIISFTDINGILYDESLYFYRGYTTPNYKEVTNYDYMIPLQDRKFSKDLDFEDKGTLVYAKIVNYLSKNRYNINFYELYANNKNIIRKKLSKEIYDKKFKDQINILLEIYDFFIADDTLGQLSNRLYYEDEEQEMTNEEQKLLYERIDLLVENRQTTVDNPQGYDMFFLSTFWARRYHEGNIDNVYKTLKQIQQDYR